MSFPSDAVFISGANRGIGLEFVKQFVEENNGINSIFAGCRNPESAQALQSLAKKYYQSLIIVKLDITNDQSIEDCVEKVSKSLADRDLGLNILINNAGVYDTTGLQNLTREILVKNMDVLAAGPLLLSQAFLPLLIKAASQRINHPIGSKRAAIINISSLGGSIGESDIGAGGNDYPYRMGKAALNMATKCLGTDLENEGILCVAFNPGWVKTDMGGPEATLTPKKSVSAMMETMKRMGPEHQGGFFSREGAAYRW